MKSKLFVVEVQLWHESFGGYDHKDGTKTYQVFAINEESAKKKVLKESQKNRCGWTTIISVHQITDILS